MNNHGGYLPNQGAVLPFDPSGRLPAHTGLTEVAFGRPVKSDSRFDINEIWRIVAKWWWLITGHRRRLPARRDRHLADDHPALSRPGDDRGQSGRRPGRRQGDRRGPAGRVERPRLPQHPGRPAQEPLARRAGRPQHQSRQQRGLVRPGPAARRRAKAPPPEWSRAASPSLPQRDSRPDRNRRREHQSRARRQARQRLCRQFHPVEHGAPLRGDLLRPQLPPAAHRGGEDQARGVGARSSSLMPSSRASSPSPSTAAAPAASARSSRSTPPP